MWPALITLGALVGVVAEAGAGYLAGGRCGARLKSLESAAAEVETERERLRHELADIVRERKAMAETAERLRAQLEGQLRRLSTVLAPPAGVADRPPEAP